MARGPVVYLDVDGVVSALSSRHGFDDGLRFQRYGNELVLSSHLGGRLRELDAELRWLTTWGDDANEVGALMGLPELVVAGRPPLDATASGPWKYEIVRAQVEDERRPFVWVDDDAIGVDADAWAIACGVPALLVRPRPNRGLTPDDLDAIEAFVAAWRS